MELTKHGHSCVRIDDGARNLVFDPGMFSDVDAALDGAQAVLITHEHPDHLNPEVLHSALAADSRLQLYAPASVSASFAEFGEQVVTVSPGESVDVTGFEVRTFGGQHALIHPSIPVIANVGYLVDGAVYHPGDSLIVPPVAVDTLLFPAMAPWARVSELVDYVIAVRAPRALPIHDHLVIGAYHDILRRILLPMAEQFGVEVGDFGAAVTVGAGAPE